MRARFVQEAEDGWIAKLWKKQSKQPGCGCSCSTVQVNHSKCWWNIVLMTKVHTMGSNTIRDLNGM